MTTDYDDDRTDDRQSSPKESTRDLRKPPRVWTVFVAFTLALGAVFAVQIFLIILLAIWHLANGAMVERLVEDILTLIVEPGPFMVLLMATQAVLAMAALAPAWLSPEPTGMRLGLTTPALPGWGYPILCLGSMVPVAIGTAFYYGLALVMPADKTFEQFYDQVTWPIAAVFVPLVALGPGFMEELFFRGYMQRRLLARWSPWLAILVSSALFALLHVTPHHVLFAFPAGIWLGAIAWRTGSVWPSIVCHAFINAGGSLHEIAYRLLGLPEVPPMPVCIALATVGVLCFAASVWLLARTPITAVAELPLRSAEGEPASAADEGDAR